MIVPREIGDRLLAECFGRPEGYRELQWLCDTVGGRTSGADSGRRAEDWAFGLFARWGLAGVRYEEVPIAVWTRGSIEAAALGAGGWTLTAFAHGFAPAEADCTALALDVGHAEREEFESLKAEVPGRIVLCDEGASPGKRHLHRTEKLAMAVEYGAAALMIMGSAPGGLPRTGVCHRSGSPIPSFGISLEDGERFRRMLRADTVPMVRVRMSNRIFDGVARNVLAEIPGRDPDAEVVLAGGHLDSWDISTGATDNGLGSAIVLEMARALAAVGAQPRRTLRFALWAAEETGLHGSHEYARRHAADLDRHAAVMNFDMTGDPHGFWTPGRKTPNALLRGLATQLAPLGMKDEFAHQAGLHSDHQPFMLAGVPVVCISGKLPEMGGGHYYHSVGDTLDKVSAPAQCRAACVAAHTMWALADAEERTYLRMSDEEVQAMVDEAGLREAIEAEG